MELKRDFNIPKFLKKSGISSHIEGQRVDTSRLNDFSVELARRTEQDNMATSAAFGEFLRQLLNLLKKRERMDLMYEQEQVLAAIDELKLEALKLLMLHESTLSLNEKNLVATSLG